MHNHAIIIHGSATRDKRQDPDYIPANQNHWLGWLSQQLVSQGWRVDAPLFPEGHNPDYDQWAAVFDTLDFDDQTTVVTHSAGAAFIIRYLHNHPDCRFAKVILIAPAKIFKHGGPRLQQFYNFDIDPAVKQQIGDLVIYTSDDDSPQIIQATRDLYHAVLGGRLVNFPTHGHFMTKHMMTEEFPELLQEVVG